MSANSLPDRTVDAAAVQVDVNLQRADDLVSVFTQEFARFEQNVMEKANSRLAELEARTRPLADLSKFGFSELKTESFVPPETCEVATHMDAPILITKSAQKSSPVPENQPALEEEVVEQRLKLNIEAVESPQEVPSAGEIDMGLVAPEAESPERTGAMSRASFPADYEPRNVLSEDLPVERGDVSEPVGEDPEVAGDEENAVLAAPIAPLSAQSLGNQNDFYEKMDRFGFGSAESYATLMEDEEKYLNDSSMHIRQFENGREFNRVVRKAQDLDTICLVKQKDRLGMTVPDLTFDNLSQHIDNMNDSVIVLNSLTQESIQTTFNSLIGEFVNANQRADTTVHNLISFDVSDRKELSELLDPPLFVLKNSMVDQFERRKQEKLEQRKIQTKEARARREGTSIECGMSSVVTNRLGEEAKDGGPKPRANHVPAVTKYLHLTMKKSMLDVHVDYSGTAAFYHLIKGQNIFFIAPPTPSNLDTYEKVEENGVEGWKGSEFKGQWTRVVVEEGQTIFIPAACIYFVVTPEDSIVFNGAFFLLPSLEKHFRISKLDLNSVMAKRLTLVSILAPFFDFMTAFAYYCFNERLMSSPDDESMLAIGRIFLRELNEHLNSHFPLEQALETGIKTTVKLLERTMKIENEPTTSNAGKNGCKRKAIGTSSKNKRRRD